MAVGLKTTIVDYSSYQHNGLYFPHTYVPGTFSTGDPDITFQVAGLVTGDYACFGVIDPAAPTFVDGFLACVIGVGGAIGTHIFTAPTWPSGTSAAYVRGWVETVNVTDQFNLVALYSGTSEFVACGYDGANLYARMPGGPFEGASVPYTFLFPGTYQICCTYSQAHGYTFYVDGTSVATAASSTGVPVSSDTYIDQILIGYCLQDRIIGGTFHQKSPIAYDEIDFGNVELTGAQVAADYATGTLFSAYSAAVLNRAPWGYYHLNEAEGYTPPPPTPPASFVVPELFIPHKNNEHSANWRTIEMWAENVRQLLNP